MTEAEKAAQADEKTPLLNHLLELRKRVMIILAAFMLGSLLCYGFSEQLYGFLVQPLAAKMEGEQRRLIYTGLTEAFFTYLKLSVYGGFVLAFPVIAAQFYAFLAPGLYRHERKVFLPYLFAGPILFLIGAAFCYHQVFPMAWKFFLSFETADITSGLPVQLEARVSEYLGLTLHMLLAFGLSFQLPVVLVLLAQFGMVRTETLRRGRRYAVVAIAGGSAFITPPDIFSMVALMLPLYLLYEASILVCGLVEPKHNEE